MLTRSQILIPVLVALLTRDVHGQRSFDDVKIKTTKVAGNIYMLEGSGGNIGVSAGPDGILIIDDQFAPLAKQIRTALKGIQMGELKFVLNTHFHGDHTGGNVEFGPEAPIIAHDNVRARLSSEQTVLGRVNPPLPKEGLPVITFDKSLSIHFNGEEIKVIHYPHSHTDGDSVIFFTKSNVVHMGDLFFAGRFPFVDVGSGGNVLGLTNSIAALIDQVPADAKIIPGHGPLSSHEDLKQYHGMLMGTTAVVQDKLATGKTLEQIKAEGLPDEWKAWGSGFINEGQWIEIINASLEVQ